MLRFNIKNELMMIVPILAAMVYVAFAWSSAPEKIPVHWNLAGEVDRFGNRFEGMLVVPLIALGLYLVTLIVPAIDPGKDNYKTFSRVFFWIRLLMVWIVLATYAGSQFAAFGVSVDMAMICGISIGVLFLFLGNFMTKIRPNWFVGIRTPWTLSSQRSWNKTHRLGGWMFLLLGFIFLAQAIFVSQWVLGAILALTLITTAVLTCYSYLVWRSDPDKISPAGVSPASVDELDTE